MACDLVVSFASVTNSKRLSVQFVLSPQRGMASVAKYATNSERGDVFGFVLATNLVGLYPPDGRPTLAAPAFKGYVQMFVNILGTTNRDQPFNFTFGGGFNSAEDTGAPACRLRLTLAPAAFIRLAHQKDATNRFQGGKWIVGLVGVADSALEVDDQSGRLYGHGKDKDSNFTIQFDFETNGFGRAIEQLEAGTTNRPNRFDTNKPLSSFVAFVAEELLRSRFLQTIMLTNFSGESRIQLATLAATLLSKGVLAPLNRLVPRETEGPAKEETFFIPGVPVAAGTGADFQKFVAAVAPWLVKNSDQFFPVGSWPWTLLREAVFGLQGKAQYTMPALIEIGQSDQTGPLGFLAAAQMMQFFNPRSAKSFAARGLQQLSTADFRRDATLLLDDNSIFGQCLLNLAEAVRDLDNVSLEFFAALQSPARAQLIRQSAALMRAAKGRPTSDVLAPALDAYWENELKQQVATALRGLAGRK